MSKRIVWRRALPALIVAGLLCDSAWALNGLIMYGIGGRSRAMGGANGAAPVDTSTILVNPAGLGRLGKTADFGAHVLFPKRYIDRTDATGPLVNTDGGLEYSSQWTYVTPFSGVSWRKPESPWAIGHGDRWCCR